MKTLIMSTVFMVSLLTGAESKAIPPLFEPQIKVSLFGYEREQPVFLVDIVNTENDVITITFMFDNGEILYIDRFSERNYIKRFRMNIENIEDAGLRLEIRSKKTGKTETFEIKKNVKYFAETTITKLK